MAVPSPADPTAYTTLRKGVARLLQDDGFADRVKAELSGHMQSHPDPLARCRALNSWLSTGEVWKDEARCGEAIVSAEREAGSSKKRRKQPASLHECSSCSESDSEPAVDSDAAFEILSLLSALREPGDAPQQKSEEGGAPTLSLHRSSTQSAEWLLLDVIESLEQPEINTHLASSAGSMEMNPALVDCITQMSPIQTAEGFSETASRMLSHDEHKLGETEHVDVCQLVRSESCSGVGCREDLNASHAGRECTSTTASGNITNEGAGSRGLGVVDADLSNSVAEGTSEAQNCATKPFGRASNHIRQCLELTKLSDQDHQDLLSSSSGHEHEGSALGGTDSKS